MDVDSIAEYVLKHKPGVDGKIEASKLVSKFKKKNVLNECESEEDVKVEMRKVADEMLIEYNLEERRKMGDHITIEEIYPIVRNTVSYHKKSLDEYALDEEDLVQAVILKVYLNFANFEGRAAISTWIYRITFNELTNLIIYHNRAKRKIKNNISFEHSDFEFESENTIESEIMAEERVEEAKLILFEKMSERDAQINSLVLDGFGYNEVCEILGVELSAVRKAVSNARGIFPIE